MGQDFGPSRAMLDNCGCNLPAPVRMGLTQKRSLDIQDGAGAFGGRLLRQYLHQIARREPTTACWECVAAEDTAEHWYRWASSGGPNVTSWLQNWAWILYRCTAQFRKYSTARLAAERLREEDAAARPFAEGGREGVGAGAHASSRPNDAAVGIVASWSRSGRTSLMSTARDGECSNPGNFEIKSKVPYKMH